MQIALFKNTSVVSSTIRKYTRSPYSHCALILDDGRVIEAREFKGVRVLASLNDAMDKGSIADIYDFDATPEQILEIQEFLTQQIGKEYDYLMIVGFVVRASREGRKSTNRWFCSELVYAALEKANIILLNNIKPWEVSPGILSYSPKIRLTKSITKLV
jgi:uncharacterized protein YycO